MARRSQLWTPSRRRLLQASAATMGGALVTAHPRVARASETERRFLFVYCYGGWDYSYVFAPLFDNDYVDSDPNSTAAEAHGVPYVDAETRPAVRTFFEAYADRACIVNGFEVPSVTHPRCRQFLFTGSGGGTKDDFPSILAGHSTSDLLLPYTVLSGPAYNASFASQVVRVGEDAQLPKLLDGTALDESDVALSLPSADTDALLDAYVRERTDSWLDAAGPGRPTRFGTAYQRVLQQIGEVDEIAGDLDFSATTTTDQVLNGITLLELGISRCVTVQDMGLYGMSWDSHSANSDQTYHYELLFTLLNEIMAELDARTGLSGGPLSDEVTVVVCSEMGRDPRLNGSNGKHHWTYTSAMFVGAGVQGGRVIGSYDESVAGSPVDLESGEVSETGTKLEAKDIGATILALGDVDPGDYLNDADVLSAVLA